MQLHFSKYVLIQHSLCLTLIILGWGWGSDQSVTLSLFFCGSLEESIELYLSGFSYGSMTKFKKTLFPNLRFGMAYTAPYATPYALPSNVIFHQNLSSVKVPLPSKVVSRQRLSLLKVCLPSKVVFC